MSTSPSEVSHIFAAVVSELAAEAGVCVGQAGKKGFGSSALQVNGKIFAMLTSKGALVLKLPRQRVAQLEAGGIGQRFDPGHGRLMKEWLELHDAEPRDCLLLAREALHFVGGGR